MRSKFKPSWDGWPPEALGLPIPGSPTVGYWCMTVSEYRKPIEVGEKRVLLCNPFAEKGDPVLVMVHDSDLGGYDPYTFRHLARVTSDLRRPYDFPQLSQKEASALRVPGGFHCACEYEYLFKFADPLPKRDFRNEVMRIPILTKDWEHIDSPDWSVPRLGLWAYDYNGVPMSENLWRHLNQMLAERNPDYPVEMERRGINLWVSWDGPRLRPEPKREAPPPKPAPMAVNQSPDPEIIRKVEKAAVSHVRKILQAKGWQVVSVETMKCGYDLHCTTPDGEMHVEVKGTRGDEPSFMLTRGEHERAQSDPKFALYLVLRALDAPRLLVFSGGELLRKFDFQTVQYKATEK